MNSELQKQADLLLSKWHQSAAARTKDMISCLRKMSGKNLKRPRAEDERLYKLVLNFGGRKSSCLNRTLGVPNDINGATMVALLKPLLLFACSYPSPLVLSYLKGEGYMVAENMDIHMTMDNALFTSLLIIYVSSRTFMFEAWCAWEFCLPTKGLHYRQVSQNINQEKRGSWWRSFTREVC